MGKFTLFEGKNGQYYFNLKAANGEIILQSEGYTAKSSAKNGINSVKSNAPIDDHYDRKRSKNDQYYFTLKAGNGEVIGVSETYTTSASMENGIESVKTNAPNAEIVEMMAHDKI